MLRISLDRIINLLERSSARKVTLAEISQKTGIHRNILSRILNRPETNCSTFHIEKLLEYFFYELRPHMKNMPDENLSAYVISNFLEFFPEQAEHASFLAALRKLGDSHEIPVTILWEFFHLRHGAPSTTDLSADEEWEQTQKLKKRLRPPRKKEH